MKKTILLMAAIFVMAVPAAGRAALTSGMVSQDLASLTAAGATPQTLYNRGFILSYQYGPTKETAEALYKGYAQSGGGTPEQQKALEDGARYWEQEYKYWGRPKPRTKDAPRNLAFYMRYQQDRQSTLRMFPPGDQRYRAKDPYRWRYGRQWATSLKMFQPQAGGPAQSFQNIR